MKQLVVVAILVNIFAGLALAADKQESEKDWCLLGIASKCEGTTTIDLIDEIRRLNVAINKGTAVYTSEEQEHLKRKLEDAHTADEILKWGR